MGSSRRVSDVRSNRHALGASNPLRSHAERILTRQLAQISRDTRQPDVYNIHRSHSGGSPAYTMPELFGVQDLRECFLFIDCYVSC